MKTFHASLLLALTCRVAFAVSPVTAGDAPDALPAADDAHKAPSRLKSLKQLESDEHSSIAYVETSGERPSIIFVPVIHDHAYGHLSTGTGMDQVRTIMADAKNIAGHLYESYGVRNLMLEGLGRKVAGFYNQPERKGQPLGIGAKHKLTGQTWSDIVGSHPWNLVATNGRGRGSPLTNLGYEYNERIKTALDHAKQKGWFRSRDAFVNNQEAFQRLMGEACKGYNKKLGAILKEDPDLKREYEAVVTRRNRGFIDQLSAAKGPGLLICGAGHAQDLIDQLDRMERSYVLLVPRGVPWPVQRKNDEAIRSDMLKHGCQLDSVRLRFGDGSSAHVQLPINVPGRN